MNITLEQALDFIKYMGLEKDLSIFVKSDEYYRLTEMKEVAKNYGGCQTLKIKAEWEGLGYFYSGYTDLTHIPYNVYKSYIDDEDCWCGKCEQDFIEESE